MESKWHKGDKVWWANTHYWFVTEMRIKQIIRVQIDDDPVQVRYRLETLNGSETTDEFDMDNLGLLDREWPIYENDLFVTKQDALDELFKRMRQKVKDLRNSADSMERDIEFIKNRLDYKEGEQNGN